MLSKLVFPSAGLFLCVAPLCAHAQSNVSNIVCDHVTIDEFVSFDEESNQVDWFALAGHTNPHESNEGCLIDTSGISQSELKRIAEGGAALEDFLKDYNGVQDSGTNLAGDRNKNGQRNHEGDGRKNLTLWEAFEQNPLLLYAAIGFVVISALGIIGVAGAKFYSSVMHRNARRFTCKISAKLKVEDLVIKGRIVRFGPGSCQFIPDAKMASDRVAGILMRSDVPDFDLSVGGTDYPIVPDVPGSRFTSLFFVRELSKDVVREWIEASETPARREKTPPKVKVSSQREMLKRMRRSRLSTRLA